jgi:hypothetical protein
MNNKPDVSVGDGFKFGLDFTPGSFVAWVVLSLSGEGPGRDPGRSGSVNVKEQGAAAGNRHR